MTKTDRNAPEAIGEYVAFTGSYSDDDAEKQISRAMQPEREAAEKLALALERITSHAMQRRITTPHSPGGADVDECRVGTCWIKRANKALAEYRKVRQ